MFYRGERTKPFCWIKEGHRKWEQKEKRRKRRERRERKAFPRLPSTVPNKDYGQGDIELEPYRPKESNCLQVNRFFERLERTARIREERRVE